MNKIHKFSMAIVAVVMIAGFSAFKVSESKDQKIDPAFETWYFNGTGSDSVTDASKYSKTPDYDCGLATQTICEIRAPEDDLDPSIPNLLALAEGFSNPTDPTVTQQINLAMGPMKPTNETVQSFRQHE